MMTRMAQSTGRHGLGAVLRRTAAALVLVLVPALASCTTDKPGGDNPPERNQAALEVVLVEGVGTLDEEALAQVETDVGDVLSRYLLGAFLGDFPRDDFVPSFGDFTSRAARGAAEDIDLLTAAQYQDADRVEATRLRVRIACLAAGGDVIGATAEVDFEFDVTRQETERPFGLTGRFLLAQEDGQWSIFGYDVHRDDLGGGAR
jgi:hypothetical protein